MLINIPLGIANILVILFVNQAFGQAMTWVMLPCIDACFLYHWIEQHNKNLYKVGNNE